MKVVLSWLKDFVDIDMTPEEVARTLTMIGLEVEEIRLVGLPADPNSGQEFKVTGLSWEPDKIVVAQIDEVMPHPNADRLVLCRLQDGQGEQIVLTGAPNLFEYKGKGPLEKPLKVAYAKEGAQIYDGHQPGQVLTTLKRAKIRGVESFSMVCSEKELGISEEHEGIIILDEDAPTGMPLVEYMGDVVFEVDILPNMIRNASMLGVARELAAVTGKQLRRPDAAYEAKGQPIEGMAAIQIEAPELNPRFVLGLITGVEPKESPYWVQRRLRLAGMRPINSIVDATNYVMLEIGEPLHAFDYDVLVERAGGKPPTIITRTAQQGEKLTTLDGVERTLDDFTVLVCDTAGSLSIAGVMGGLESEVTGKTRNVLLEGANWNYINVRRTMASQKMTSEAGWRFSRGVHPELSPYGVQLGLKRMLEWGGGVVHQGLIDNYPQPAKDPEVCLTTRDIRRLLGIDLNAQQIADLLSRLEFTCRVEGDTVLAKTPPIRLDIGEGVIGTADLAEEVARMYGYDNIPATRLDTVLPAQRGNRQLELEERIRDALVDLGLQEVVNYRLTSPEREANLLPDGAGQKPPEYIQLKNPLSPERSVMRRSLLAGVIDTVERNSRLRDRLALFEIGPVFIPRPGQLPEEPVRLAIAMTGLRQLPTWDQPNKSTMDFFDLKGILEAMLDMLHVNNVQYEPAQHPSFHPGKCAQVIAGETVLGVFGELHPLVKEKYDFGPAPVLAADIDLDELISVIPWRYESQSVPTHPPVLEDIAVIVEENIPAARVEEAIRQGGGKMLANVRLFDVFRSEAIGEGKKSLAYSLTYQAPDRTLNDADAKQIRQRIIRRLEHELGAKLRS
ncbi:MAG: phenylalanine--tRNA ligase subunit beta [Chloroflexi bacterium]|nr:phenylalanine--tRNA ligase subunit beta [Chloroflexota bacterium]